MNRLKLDFSIQTAEKRKVFIDNYLKTLKFTPNQTELDLIASYILWGEKKAYVDSKIWGKKTESLDALMETNFQPAPQIQLKTPKHNFDRAAELKAAPPDLKPVLERLFVDIDKLDYTTAKWELLNGRRTKPIRPELTARVANPRDLDEYALELTEFQYLKLRRQLIEKRREQYTVKDFYAAPLQSIQTPHHFQPAATDFGVDIRVEPLGLNTKALIPIEELEHLKTPIKLHPQPQAPLVFDFREVDHLAKLGDALEDLRDAAAANENPENTTPQFLEFWDFYRENAGLDEVQTAILEAKLDGRTNQDIAIEVNAKFGKSYRPNYISTLWRQKILGQIGDFARKHAEVVEATGDEERFKTCSLCGARHLKSSDWWTRRARSKDGFSSRCKVCEKKTRDKRKEKEAGTNR